MIKNFGVLLLAVAMLFISICFCCPQAQGLAHCEGYNYVNDDLNDVMLISSNYDFDNAISFTPFDFSIGSRMNGKSARFDTDEYKQFSQTFPLSGEALGSIDYECGFWMYFSTKHLHNLKITLTGSGANFTITISKSDLQSLLQKQIDLARQDQENDGYGWNFIEIPLNAFVCSINSYDETNTAFSAVTFEFFSLEPGDNIDYATVYLYEFVMKPTESANIIVKEQNKQPFRFIKTKFYTAEELNYICVGDKLKVKYRTDSIIYAWIGDKNVRDDANYEFVAKLTTPETTKTLNADVEFEIDKIGEYTLEIALKHNGEKVLVSYYRFNANNFFGIYFEQSLNELTLGKTYSIRLTKNNKLVNFSNLHFAINNNCATIIDVDEERAIVYIRAIEEGPFTLTATAKGSRALAPDEVTYTASLDCSVKRVQEKNNTALIVILSIMLGIIVITGLVLGIKSIVNANKYKVR